MQKVGRVGAIMNQLQRNKHYSGFFTEWDFYSISSFAWFQFGTTNLKFFSSQLNEAKAGPNSRTRARAREQIESLMKKECFKKWMRLRVPLAG